MTCLKPFKPLDFPLDGLQLIEASAGTGKTFSLAGLFLRLLLEKRLEVSQILVITFTHAATQELRARIRTRLVTAAGIAADPARLRKGDAEDELAEAMIRRCEEHEERSAVAKRLRHAALRIDEAAISTIHGFAQRAVAEQAFDSGLPFDRGEQVDDASVFEETTADYWRQQAFDAADPSRFLTWWPTPEKLGDALREVRLKPHVRLSGMDSDELHKACKQLRTLWKKEATAFGQTIHDFRDNRKLKAKPLKHALENYASTDEALADLHQAIESESTTPLLPDWVAELRDAPTQFMAKNLDEGEAFLALPLPRLLCELHPQPRRQALRQAHAAITGMAAERKRLRRQYSFADMISALHNAVCDPQQGEALCRSLHEAWPWMLVDEFQDTDPQQYDILKRIHGAGEDGGLLLIGDPKQSIYGFRGGDVFAYLHAANDAGGQRFNLTHNFRSTAAVIQATEALFRAPENLPFLAEGIDYQSVAPGRSDRRELRLDGQPQAGLNIWQLKPEKTTKAVAELECQNATVAHIVDLLDKQGGAEISREKEHDGVVETTHEPVRPRDIAVLVNTNRQAADMQRALARAGVASVCVHQQSVFATEEAQDLLRILLAAENPTDEPLIRAALITTLLGYRLGQIIDLQDNDEGWQKEIERFQSGLELWRRHGVLAFLQPLIQSAAARLLGWEDGERRISNYLQLAELLAAAESESFGTSGLLAWLREAMERGRNRNTADNEQLRLESDEALVRIVTVHRAKGLEYPIVFLPFAPWLGGMGYPNKPPFSYHDSHGNALVEITDDEAARSAAIIEARAEGIRQLYVALTRAEIACYLPWGAVNLAANSALASLLHRGDKIPPDYWSGNNRSPAPLDQNMVDQALESLGQSKDQCIAILPMPAATRAMLAPNSATAQPSDARSDLPAAARPWSVFSFTRLIRASEPGIAASGAGDEEPRPGEMIDAGEQLPDLPGGPGFGSAIHDLLEQILNRADAPQWRQLPQVDPDRREQIRTALRRYGISLDGSDAERLVDGASALITQGLFTPLSTLGCLGELPRQRLRAELEFMFRLRGKRLSAFHEALVQAGYARDLPVEQTGLRLRGLMHGFIDLIAEQDGRYYVIDYKTNWLGNQAGQYNQAALARAMAQHHYDLQYLIYQIALHRFLRQRLPGYDPAQQLGGVFYLFLRGMAGDAGDRGVFHDQPDPQLLLRLDALLDSATEEAPV